MWSKLMNAYRRGRLTLSYAVQRRIVGLMFHVLGRLLVACPRADTELQREIHGFPNGFTIAFSILGDPHTMRVRILRGRFVRVEPSARPDLEIVFKHMTHAFHVLTFQESAAEVYANDRATTHGDIALAMRFVRCLGRAQALALPGFVVEHALKAPLPTFEWSDRVRRTGALYGNLVTGIFTRAQP